MEPTNPYTPPAAELAEPAVAEAPYFAVSNAKLVVMSTATLGLYDFWWFYQNLKAVQRRTQRPMSPFWRAMFAPLWSFSLLPEIQQEARALQVESAIATELCSVVFLVLSATLHLPDPYWMISLLAFVALLPANATARRINLALAPDVAARPWSGWEILFAVLGGLILVLNIVAVFLPELGEAPR